MSHDMHDGISPKHLWLVIVGAVAIFAGLTGLVWLKQIDYKRSDHPALTSKPTPLQKQQTVEPSLVATTVEYEGVSGKTALEILETIEKTTVTKESSQGPYVDSIQDKESGENGRYWTLYINGKLAQVGAQEYITKLGDKIEWKFE